MAGYLSRGLGFALLTANVAFASIACQAKSTSRPVAPAVQQVFSRADAGQAAAGALPPRPETLVGGMPSNAAPATADDPENHRRKKADHPKSKRRNPQWQIEIAQSDGRTLRFSGERVPTREKRVMRFRADRAAEGT